MLQAHGHESAATEVLIGKKTDLRRYGKLNGISWIWNYLLEITISYGYRPHRALYFALLFVALGTFLFSWGYSQFPRLISPSSSLPSQPGYVSVDYPKFNSLVYSFDVFIPIMNLHQQSYWLPNANRGKEISLLIFKCKMGSLLRYYFWLHIVLGWIFTSLWVASFTGIVRRVE